ncbi:MAG: ribosome silencing factor [Acidobacteria bacterium]|nr:MAG: ribosome silencing factor [Acidobacteriota bacterium]REJ98929.1 MAG: ribosome silencing factor [Acidobacteriota bacterium]REK16351.1 MAG: ribosome silencing factor [Acidobacteriota bacterium]REK44032.1 MAG: ribosome silencing factor [Acidobacteriota bacterium]
MEEAVKEKYLKREGVSETINESSETTAFEDLDAEVRLAIACAEEKKAQDTIVLDLREITSFTEHFVITSGSNQRQVQAICDEITEQLKKQMKAKAIRIEGYSTGEWILIDYGDFVIHIFSEKSRGFYDLERLWRDAKRVNRES